MELFRLYNRACRRVVEAAVRPAKSEQAWVDQVFDAWLDAFASWDNMTASTLHRRPDDDAFSSDVTRFLESDRVVDGYVHITKTRDAVGIVVHPVPCTTLVLLAQVRDGSITMDRNQRKVLEQVGFHLESGYRLQHLGASSILAEVSKDGEVRRFDETLRDVWPALIEGRASLVDTAAIGSKAYRVVSNPSHARRLRGLTPRELDILNRAARGDTAKSIAYALGISPPLVSNALAYGAAKLGVATRTELVRLAALFTREPRPELDSSDVTLAEREVLDLVREGLRNEEIAKRRGRSVRTVANQVSSLLRKTGRVSRRALAVP